METKLKEGLPGESKLKTGMRIKLPHSGVFDVVLVNESRAHIVPAKKQEKKFETLTGNKVEFEQLGRGLDISPNSEVEVL
jgi:hypothetical protein